MITYDNATADEDDLRKFSVMITSLAGFCMEKLIKDQWLIYKLLPVL